MFVYTHCLGKWAFPTCTIYCTIYIHWPLIQTQCVSFRDKGYIVDIIFPSDRFCATTIIIVVTTPRLQQHHFSSTFVTLSSGTSRSRNENMAIKSEKTIFFVELAVTICTGICVLFVRLFSVPSHRGFFCNDESIKYPYKARSTVPNTVLIVVDLLYPAIAVSLFYYSKSPDKHLIPSGIHYKTLELIV